MQIADQFDISTLAWIKGEIDETLKQARTALEAFVDEPQNDTLIQECAEHIHQVYGTLQMVELYGAAMFAEEMETYAAILKDGGGNEQRYELLMRAILQLPDYLESLLAGKADNPAILLPILNELRQQRGVAELNSAEFFHPNLAITPPPRMTVPPTGVDSVFAANRLHRFFMSSLVKILKAIGVPGYLSILERAVSKLYDIAEGDAWRRLTWVATAFVEALGEKSIALDKESKPLLGKLEQQVKRVAAEGEAGMDAEAAEALLRKMLYLLAHSGSNGKRAAQVRLAFDLDRYVPGNEANIVGLNAELKRTVAADIMEELSQVKDAFDVFVRGDRGNVQSLEPLAESLERIGETLSLLQQDTLRESLRQQLETIQRLVSGEVEASDDTLMGIAGAILAVESALGDWGNAMPMVKADAGDEQIGSEASTPEAEAEHQRVTRQVMKESKDDLVRVREAINAYLDNPQDKSPLKHLPQMLHLIVGSLNMLSYKRVAQVLMSTRAYIEAELIAKSAVPAQDKLDALADAIMSVEYYLEAFVNSRVHPSSVLDVAENAVALLGYPIGTVSDTTSAATHETPELEGIEVVEPMAAGVDDFGDDALGDLDIESFAAPVTKNKPAPAPVHATPVSGEVDEEILEIFIEEAKEELENIRQLLPAWMENPADEESLKNLRRSFHTLKGSGRLVGALNLGEFAWAYENMLNRVIDGTVGAGAAMFDLLQQGADALPELIEQFSQGTSPQSDTEMLREMAWEMAEPGSAPVVHTPPPAPAPTPELPQLDPALLEVYSKEAEGHLQAIDEYIEEWRGGGSHKPTEPLLRALHTLKGSSRMAGVMETAEVCELLEKYGKTLQANQQSVDEEGIAALASASEYVRKVLACLLAGEHTEAPPAKPVIEQARKVFSGIQHLEEIANAQPEAGLAVVDEAPEQAVAIEELELDVTESGLDEEAPAEALTLEMPGESLDLEALPELEIEPATAEEAINFDSLDEIDLGDWQLNMPSEPTQASNQGTHEEEYDTELLDIFLEEGADILDSSETTLQAWVDNPEDNSLVESLQRQLHTLKGGARMAGIAAIGDLSHSLESTFEAVVEGQLQRTPEMMNLLQLSHDRLVTMLEQVRKHEAVTPANDLIEKVAILTQDALPADEAVDLEPIESEPFAPIEIDTGLEDAGIELAESISVGGEINAELELAITEVELSHGNWLRDIDDRAAFEELYRSASSLVSICSANEPPQLADVSSALERLLAAIMDGHVEASKKSSDAISLSLELLRRMAVQHSQGLPVDDGRELILEIDELIAHSLAEETLEAGDIASNDAGVAAAMEAERETVEDAVQWKRVEPSEDGSDKRQAPRIQHEMVRVRSDLLDNLVNYAGEVSIYRSRVEQQIGSFRSNIGEMDRTVERLHEQVRAFEIENEAQIESRREEAMKTQEDFDPLEMDRFTHMQQLSRSMSESLNDLLSIEDMLTGLVRESETLLLQQSRVNTELQENLMHTRMVPLVDNAPRLRRIVRQTASELGKRVSLKFDGADVEMDRNVVERMMAPLEHMIRNSIAHGLEDPKQRKKAGKPEEGAITIALAREGSEIVIRVSDDGAGIDIDAVRKKAIARGMLAENAVLTDKEVLRFILESGFSTAQSLSQIAGRGVGMDVVNSEIKQLGGVLEIDSTPGKGAIFTMRIPLTLSVSRALLVHVAEDTYAVPLLSVNGIERMETAELERLLASEEPTLNWLGEEYDLMHLTKVLGMGPGILNKELPRQPLLMARSGQHRMAFAVDHLVGSREIVIKSLGTQLSTLQDIAGATILADGSVALIIDMPSLIRRGVAHKSRADVTPVIPITETVAKEPLIMVVDDSITVRKVTERLLKRHNMRCVTARDGVDALAQLEEHIPDVMLLDIEMPRMDGFELATHMRNSDRFREVPIIMITSRTGDKHRQRAMEIGVNMYMGKPYTEVDLLENIESLTGKS